MWSHLFKTFSKSNSPVFHFVKPSSQPSIAKPPSLRTTFLPVEVGEIPSLVSQGESLISCGESLMPHGELRIEIVTPSGLVLRLPGETALDVLAWLVRQLESVSY
ncbi:MAG: hypothetical protein FWD31_06075 [Planctomycetaceae bacterium]|nr:hypothetical protein [Planctomycetaceae bacterium]